MSHITPISVAMLQWGMVGVKCMVQEQSGSLTSTMSNCTTFNSSNVKGCSGSLMDLIRSETKLIVMSLWHVGGECGCGYKLHTNQKLLLSQSSHGHRHLLLPVQCLFLLVFRIQPGWHSPTCQTSFISLYGLVQSHPLELYHTCKKHGWSCITDSRKEKKKELLREEFEESKYTMERYYIYNVYVSVLCTLMVV